LTSELPENYREARADEAFEIAALQFALAGETDGRNLGLETCMRGVRAVFDDPAKGRYYVATLGRQIAVSLLVTYEWSDWRNGTMWRIEGVHVPEEHRGGPLLPGLLDFVKALAMVDPSAQGIRLSVGKEDYVSKKIYSRLGFAAGRRERLEWLKIV
jgi:hypothetical protein